MLDPVVLDHPRTRAFSTARKQRRLPSTPSPGPAPSRERGKCVCACVYVLCSARAQDDHFQDTTFSIASGFTLASLRLLPHIPRPRVFHEISKPLACCRAFATEPAKAKRPNSNTGFTASSPYHTKPGLPAATLCFSSTFVFDRFRTIYPSKMMSSRNINNLPAHGAPSRDDFAKLDERQRDQINDVVCCLATPPHIWNYTI